MGVRRTRVLFRVLCNDPCKRILSSGFLLICGCMQDVATTSISSSSTSQSQQAAQEQVTPVASPSSAATGPNQPLLAVRPGASATPTATSTSSNSNGNTSSLTTYFDPFNMPLLDQTDSSLSSVGGTNLIPNGASNSALCGPTSGTMVLNAVTAKVRSVRSVNPTPGSWTANSFQGLGWQIQVKNMVTLMNTDLTNGTTLPKTILGVATRAGDFASSISQGSSSQWMDPITTTFLQGKVSFGSAASAVALDIGFYKTQMTTTGGSTFITFKRNGGHFVAIRGYLTDSSGNTLFLINNPWNAVQERYLLKSFGASGSGVNSNASLNNTNSKFTDSNGSAYTNSSGAIMAPGHTYISGGSVIDSQDTFNPPANNSQFSVVEGYSALSAPLH